MSEKRETYRGKAVIMNVELIGVEDWKDWEKRSLSEIDRSNAFKIAYDVAEGDANGKRHEVCVEISHRELVGVMLDYFKREDGTTPTQMDLAIRSLIQQRILPKGAKEADIGMALNDSLVGREVTIRAFEELGRDGASWWPRCVFASARQRISGDAVAARVAAFLSGKPAPAPTAATSTSAIPSAPAEEPDDSLPF